MRIMVQYNLGIDTSPVPHILAESGILFLNDDSSRDSTSCVSNLVYYIWLLCLDKDVGFSAPLNWLMHFFGLLCTDCQVKLVACDRYLYFIQSMLA